MIKKETLAQKEERLAVLRKEMAELEPARKRYFDICFVAGKLAEDIAQMKRDYARDRLEYETRYVRCEFPGMGHAGVNGEAVFKTEDQAVELCEALGYGNYYRSYYVKEWKGPGRYILVPDWKKDHDGDTIYKGVFEKGLDD